MRPGRHTQSGTRPRASARNANPPMARNSGCRKAGRATAWACRASATHGTTRTP